MAQTLYRQFMKRLILSVMLAFIPMSCASERTNAPKKVRNSALTVECRVADRCEASNG
jgi:uncharacterized membrane protein